MLRYRIISLDGSVRTTEGKVITSKTNLTIDITKKLDYSITSNITDKNGVNSGLFIINLKYGDPHLSAADGGVISAAPSIGTATSFNDTKIVSTDPSTGSTIKGTSLVTSTNQKPKPLPLAPSSEYILLTTNDGGQIVLPDLNSVVNLDPVFIKTMSVITNTSIYPTSYHGVYALYSDSPFIYNCLDSEPKAETGITKTVASMTVLRWASDIKNYQGKTYTKNSTPIKINWSFFSSTNSYLVDTRYWTVVKNLNLAILEGDNYPLNPYTNSNQNRWYYIKYPDNYVMPAYSSLVTGPMDTLITPENIPTPTTMNAINGSLDVVFYIEISNDYGTVSVPSSLYSGKIINVNVGNNCSVFRIKSKEGIFFDTTRPVIFVTNANNFDDTKYVLYLKPNSFGVLNVEIDITKLTVYTFLSQKNSPVINCYDPSTYGNSISTDFNFMLLYSTDTVTAIKNFFVSKTISTTNTFDKLPPVQYFNTTNIFFMNVIDISLNGGKSYENFIINIAGVTTGEKVILKFYYNYDDANSFHSFTLSQKSDYIGNIFVTFDKNTLPLTNLKVMGITKVYVGAFLESDQTIYVKSATPITPL